MNWCHHRYVGTVYCQCQYQYVYMCVCERENGKQKHFRNSIGIDDGSHKRIRVCTNRWNTTEKERIKRKKKAGSCVGGCTIHG